MTHRPKKLTAIARLKSLIERDIRNPFFGKCNDRNVQFGDA